MNADTNVHWRGLVPVLGILLAGCDVSVGQGGLSFDLHGGRAQDTWTRTYEVAPDGRLEILNVNGRIEVTGGAGSAIEILAERTVKAHTDETAKGILARIEMAERVSPTAVRLEARPPAHEPGWSHEIRYRIKVPRTLGVDVETTNGGVSVNGVNGPIRAVTTNGGIAGRELGGAVDATTTNGGIRLDFARIEAQTITLESMNGGIEVRVPDSAKASLLARCTNGSVSVSGVSHEAVGERSRRRFEARLNGGGPARIHAETTNGGITIAGTT
jgi:hypothetical protein